MVKWAMKHPDLASAETFRRLVAWQKNPKKAESDIELRKALLDFISDFSNWDNSTNEHYLSTSQTLTQVANECIAGEGASLPLVVDPFAGGGTIPLEALRVGANTFSSDLNPVPVLLNKVVLEYIPKFGLRLAEEIRKWGGWLKAETEKAVKDYYPKDPNGATPIAYLWARTIRCEGPGCGAEIPLFRSPWLSLKGKNSVALKIIGDPSKKKIDFEIRVGISSNEDLTGVLRRSSVTCPLCGYTTPAQKVRDQFKGRQGGASDARLLAVVTTNKGNAGKQFRLPIPSDDLPIKQVIADLKAIQGSAPDDIPHESLPYLRSIFNINLLDVTEWCQLFSPRQLISLVKMTKLIKLLHSEVKKTTNDHKMQNAIVTCLALCVDRVAAQFSSLSWWQPKGEFVVGTFGRQALGIIWDFAEIRPVNGASGDLDGAIDWVVRVIESLGSNFCGEATVEKASATKHPLPDDSASVVFTDPPYYDAVPYADLSDFFYVFLKRMLRELYPSLFMEELTPKNGEIVQLAERNPMYAYKTKEYFEQGMQHSLLEARRILFPSGLAVVVFAHKTTQGWEVMLSSIIQSGWTITASWPIDTERAVRMRANDSAALASSVHLVCRPREKLFGPLHENEIGDWRDVLSELPRRIHEWMPRLAEEGVVGADAIFACLGPALEIFSRYSHVEKASGEKVHLKEYLEHVWGAVAKEALNMIFTGADTSGFEEDSRLTAMWLWTLNAGQAPQEIESSDENHDVPEGDDEDGSGKHGNPGGFVLEYDAARKIAQGLGAHLEQLASLIEIKGDKARLLPVSERTKGLFGKDQSQAPTKKKANKVKQLSFEAILGEITKEEPDWGEKKITKVGNTVLDRLHQTMILFAAGRSEALKRFLVEDGIGRDDRFWRLAQALSALYPSNTDEKRWVDGVLARKKSLGF